MYRILPKFTASNLQAATYLLGIALFSISFLVFLNSSISFVITDVIGQKSEVGNAVGTLGFADELVALVACPLWGIVSDRVGVLPVATAGYLIIGFSLICLVQSTHVYPDLILWRMVFSIGGAACTTMVTAVLPTMTAEREEGGQYTSARGHARPGVDRTSSNGNVNRHSLAPSVSSELTITPARFETRSKSKPLLAKYRHRRRSIPNIEQEKEEVDPHMDASRLAGFVGMFTGIGALVALAVFLPLPTALGKGIPKSQAVQNSFYIVGAVSILVAIFVAFGLRNLPGEHGKGIKQLFAFWTSARGKGHEAEDGYDSTSRPAAPLTPSYWELVKSAIVLGFTDSNIGLGYIGGFVARASSVGISLFIPLFVNAYYIKQGICTEEPGEEIKEACSQAYKLASMLTGISQLIALLSAPLFGWFNARYAKRKNLRRIPLTVAAASGVVGYIAFGTLKSPDPKAKGGHGAIIAVILVGISQIGAIVCSLGILAQGIQTTVSIEASPSSDAAVNVQPSINGHGDAVITEGVAQTESTPLLSEAAPPTSSKETDRRHLKGTIAGVYSLAGGAAILVLTKLGGRLFDTTSVGAPFYLMAGFNAALLIAALAIEGGTVVRKATQTTEDEGHDAQRDASVDRRDHSTAEPSAS
ncbi:hypothetical protein CAC42_1224 [Sphaceloma murrayae]|uniref:Uncharacterized protein n=1 Tax=Sphaceloma murrayae TaxID=2082308 RepID=A0A2K1R2D9_9PEZI|nr:hypothetical protein CAC42_1224 [Sphaceloma murrayae]